MGHMARRERAARYRAEGSAGRDEGLPCFPVPQKYRSEEAQVSWATGWQQRDQELRMLAVSKAALTG